MLMFFAFHRVFGWIQPRLGEDLLQAGELAVPVRLDPAETVLSAACPCFFP